MIALLSKLASMRLTLLGMVLLAIGAGLSYDNPVDTPVWVLAVPLAFLSFNLFAAIITKPGINSRPGLLIFHIGLLGICVLVAVGRLTYFDARIEMTQGTPFDMSAMNAVKQGSWHMGDLESVQFTQGRYTVDYSPGLVRGPTRSHVSVPDGKGGWQEQVVGDDTPLLLEGYRFYTSFNKGFAPVLTWIADNGEAVTGVIHMPAYPLFEYRQSSDWMTPNGEEIKLWLRLDTGYTMEQDWQLDVEKASAVLIVNDGEQRIELVEGEEVTLPGGRLRYEALSTWMGYKIFYDPTLHVLFISAILAVFGLAVHYWRKFADQPLAEAASTDQQRSTVSGQGLTS